MMLAVLDASPVGGGPVSRALACAADEAGGAYVRVRLYDLLSSVCGGCNACASNGRCSRRHARLDETIGAVGGAQALIVGASAHLHCADPRARALLERLAGAFARVETRRGLSDAGVGCGTGPRRAALVISAAPLLGVPAMLGILPAGLDRVWNLLERAGVDVVGCASVAPRWSGPASWDRAAASARTLGRALGAGRPRKREQVPAAVPLPHAPAAFPAIARIA